jgi:hypothetical protein
VADIIDLTLGLFEFDQRAGKVFGMKKQHRFTVRAELRLTIAEDPRAACFERIACGTYVPDLIADVVDAAVRITL